MIKTGRVEGKETGTLEMSGTLNDLMNDYNVIAKGMRKILVEKFGKDSVVKAMLVQKAQDYVIEHANIAIEYERMKLKLWKKYEFNRDDYTNSKTDFI